MRDLGASPQLGSRVTTDANTSETVSPSNGLRPVSISKSTHPNDQMSVRRSIAFPRACFGLM